MGTFHIYSNGAVSKSILFSDDAAFVFALNTIGITAKACGVCVLCVTVMGTHFHVIAEGEFLAVSNFVAKVKRSVGRWLSVCHGRNIELEISIDELTNQTDILSKFMYVLRNPIEAGYCNLPTDYHWGPGNIYFTDYRQWLETLPRVGDIPVLARRIFFHTKAEICEDWRYYPDGLIAPANYIDTERVRELFGSVKAFIAFMYQKKDTTISINRTIYSKAIADLSQQNLKRKAAYQAQILFKKTLSRTTVQERITIAITLYRAREVDSTLMLAKLLSLEPKVLDAILKG